MFRQKNNIGSQFKNRHVSSSPRHDLQRFFQGDHVDISSSLVKPWWDEVAAWCGACRNGVGQHRPHEEPHGARSGPGAGGLRLVKLIIELVSGLKLIINWLLIFETCY